MLELIRAYVLHDRNKILAKKAKRDARSARAMEEKKRAREELIDKLK